MAAHQFESGPDAGMIPHMTYWSGGGEELWQYADRSTITQPPLIGVAAWKVFSRSQNRALLEALYPRLAAFHAWFDRRRDPDGDDLVCLIHPWESGCDSSPRWDWGMHLPQHFDPASGTAARKALATRLPEYGHDPGRLGEVGSFLVEMIDIIYLGLRRYGYEALASQLAARTLELARRSGYREYYHPETGQGLGAKSQSWLALLIDIIAEERGSR